MICEEKGKSGRKKKKNDYCRFKGLYNPRQGRAFVSKKKKWIFAAMK